MIVLLIVIIMNQMITVRWLTVVMIDKYDGDENINWTLVDLSLSTSQKVSFFAPTPHPLITLTMVII